jgi:hypothetical protein
MVWLEFGLTLKMEYPKLLSVIIITGGI